MNHGRRKIVFTKIVASWCILVSIVSCGKQDELTMDNIDTISSYPIEGTAELESTFVEPDMDINFLDWVYVHPENEDAFFDFDNEMIVNNTDADIYLWVSCGTDCFMEILAVNGAIVNQLWEFDPGYEGCQNAISYTEHSQVANAREGHYICVMTNEGSLAQILVVEKETYQNNGMISFQYWIWPQITFNLISSFANLIVLQTTQAGTTKRRLMAEIPR